MHTNTLAYFNPTPPTLPLSVCVKFADPVIHHLASFFFSFSTMHADPFADAFPSHMLVLSTYRAPLGSDLPVGAEAELTRLCGLWWGEVGTALWMDHGGAVPKALPTLQLSLLHPRATGHTALWPWTGLPAEETGTISHYVTHAFKNTTQINMTCRCQLTINHVCMYGLWCQPSSKCWFLDFCKYVLVSPCHPLVSISLFINTSLF